MTVNGNLTISTYFILNKRDRSGKVVPRPFQAVLDEMKRQETETAKLKQSSSLKGSNAPDSAAAPPPPPALPPVKETEIAPPPVPKQVSIEMPALNKADSIDDDGVYLARDSVVKARPSNGTYGCPFESMSEQRESTATNNSHMRSKTCELL